MDLPKDDTVQTKEPERNPEQLVDVLESRRRDGHHVAESEGGVKKDFVPSTNSECQ